MIGEGVPFNLSVGDPGTPEVAFDHEQAETDGPGAPTPAEAAEAVQDVTEQQVRDLLPSAGKRLNRFLADPDVPAQWLLTDEEVDELAPPLTRIINRRALLKKAVHKSDVIVVADLLAEYTHRNVTDGREARAAREGTDGNVSAEAGGSGARAARLARRAKRASDRPSAPAHGPRPSIAEGTAPFPS